MERKTATPLDISLVVAAADVVGRYASQNPMSKMELAIMIADVHSLLVERVDSGPRVRIAADGGDGEAKTTLISGLLQETDKIKTEAQATDSPPAKPEAAFTGAGKNAFRDDYVVAEPNEESAGRHTRRAARAALPMPALRRPLDRHRGLRAWMRAKVAPDPKPVRHIMSQTACQRRRFSIPLRWLHAGGDLSRRDYANDRADRPLITSTPPPRSLLRASKPLHTLSELIGATFASATITSVRIKSP